MVYVISQIFDLLSFIIYLISYHQNTKKKILTLGAVSHAVNILHYLLLGATSGCISKVIAIIRNIVIINKDKNKFLSSRFVLFLFIFASLITGIYAYKNIFSLLPIISSILFICASWNGDELSIKRASFITCFLWVLYNASIYSIAGVITQSISFISSLIAFIVERRKRRTSN